jgi:hypothetical protein
MSISIFAKRSSRAHSDGHLQRVSSIIRAQQIADRIGARINPTEDYQDDVCIYVKPHVKPHEDFTFEGDPYLDIIDGWMLLPLVKRHPEVSVIACSYSDFEYISSQVNNKVVHIPQHHCNFEKLPRFRNEVTRVGVIGASAAFAFLPSGLKQELTKRNMELIEFSSFYTREDICTFYQSIDIQIVWRPYMRVQKIRLSNPLKIVNAASFGVPTVALDELAFREMKGCYLPVNNVAGLISQIDKLQSSQDMYQEYSEKCVMQAQTYHIDTVGKLYRDLVR